MKARRAIKDKNPFARISRMTLAVAVFTVAGIVAGIGSTSALFVDSADVKAGVITAGDLNIEMSDVYTWEMKVLVDPTAGSGYTGGETVSGSSDKDDLSEVLMGGDWTELTITHTGIVTVIGDNLVVAATIGLGPVTGVQGSDLTYNLSVDGIAAGTFKGNVPQFVGPDMAEGTHTIALSVTVNGAAFAVMPQVLTSPPEKLVFSQPFDIRLVQVRVP